MIPCPMDNATLTELFEQSTHGQDKFTRRIAIKMADFIGIPPMSLIWRLEKMRLLRRGSWDWFKANGGITKAHIAEALAPSRPTRDHAALDTKTGASDAAPSVTQAIRPAEPNGTPPNAQSDGPK